MLLRIVGLYLLLAHLQALLSREAQPLVNLHVLGVLGDWTICLSQHCLHQLLVLGQGQADVELHGLIGGIISLSCLFVGWRH